MGKQAIVGAQRRDLFYVDPGELEIIARFPDGVVRINQFEDLDGSE